ncbi:MAG TPA: anaerobic ribonucleoside-triphosphate reductase activating protein [Spirochaetota bacterium]|nr:anaerobic ribonucleoside-triphosphate reductase activating protein [Spirochaetota bacterium]HOM38103.1 anaerobic ribonucleoside-triphosphate reductase activating protein [Spirochaetota bacterium]HPQ48905.1 anaerobic ribonucleoside-triphosphate reductase activating protein [Spirochaetota bacterium]
MNIKIAGIIGLSLIDYPDTLAGIIFLAGCNFRCPYCHNMNIVENIENLEMLEPEFVINEFKRRKKLLDGIVITGGEPTIYKNLPIFIKKIKEIGYKIKLDTNGYIPQIIKEIIEKNLVDFISMDIKSSFDSQKYSRAAGVKVDIDKILESINIIKESNINYEFRTTIINEYVDLEDIKNIARYINPVKNYYIQTANKEWQNFTSPPEKEIKKVIEELKTEGLNFINIR